MSKKWHKIKFVLQPTELEEIFSDLDCYFPITNTRVPRDYTVEDNTSLFSKYKLYFEKVVSGKEWTKEEYKLSFYISITDSPKLIKYENFENEDGQFMRPIVLEPVLIQVAPFSLKLHKSKISVQFLDRYANIGIEFAYIKEIWDNEQQKYISTENRTTFKLYKTLTDKIKKKSKKAKVVIGNKTYKPNFWISNSCIAQINNNIMMKNEKIELI